MQETRDTNVILGSERFPGEYNNPLQYSCWRILRTEEPGSYSPQGHKDLDMTRTTQHPYIVLIDWIKEKINLQCLKNSLLFFCNLPGSNALLQLLYRQDRIKEPCNLFHPIGLHTKSTGAESLYSIICLISDTELVFTSAFFKIKI